jgi:hypothetical protein
MVAAKHTSSGKRVQDDRRAVSADAAIAAGFMDCVVEPAMNASAARSHGDTPPYGENIIIDYVGRPSKECTPDMYELSDSKEPG